VSPCTSSSLNNRRRTATLPAEEFVKDITDLRVAIMQSTQTLHGSHRELVRQVAARLLPPVEGETTSGEPSLKGYAAVLLEGARLRGQLADLALMPVYACIATEQCLQASTMQGHRGQPCYGLASLPGQDCFASVSDDKTIKVPHVSL